MSKVFVALAFNAAISSVGHASYFGIFQPKEPEILQDDGKNIRKK